MAYNKNNEGQSAFNFAIAYLKQIDETLRICKIAQINRNKTLWLSALHTLHTELSLKTTSEEDELIFNKFKEINKTIKDSPESPEVLEKLMKLEMELRKTIQKKGMALPSKDDPRWAVLKR